jgi:hypothetical protein
MPDGKKTTTLLWKYRVSSSLQATREKHQLSRIVRVLERVRQIFFGRSDYRLLICGLATSRCNVHALGTSLVPDSTDTQFENPNGVERHAAGTTFRAAVSLPSATCFAAGRPIRNRFPL